MKRKLNVLIAGLALAAAMAIPAWGYVIQCWTCSGGPVGGSTCFETPTIDVGYHDCWVQSSAVGCRAWDPCSY